MSLFDNLTPEYAIIDECAHTILSLLGDYAVELGPDKFPMALLMAYAEISAQLSEGIQEPAQDLRDLCQTMAKFLERDIQRRRLLWQASYDHDE
jgi:hypothetical protein